MIAPNVLGFLAAPDRETSLKAISLAVLKIRTSGHTYKEIAKAVDVCAETVAGAANEANLLGFDAIARLCYFWPEETSTIKELFGIGFTAPTAAERLSRIEREAAALRREFAA
jgi:hypothetical protein